MTVERAGAVASGSVNVKFAIGAAHVVALHDAVMPSSASGPARRRRGARARKCSCPS